VRWQRGGGLTIMNTEGKDCPAAMPATTGERRTDAGEHGEDREDLADSEGADAILLQYC
jgi:hypothetical protein